MDSLLLMARARLYEICFPGAFYLADGAFAVPAHEKELAHRDAAPQADAPGRLPLGGLIVRFQVPQQYRQVVKVGQ